MSRIGKCIDNKAIKAFWRMIKRKNYCGHRFNRRNEQLRTNQVLQHQMFSAEITRHDSGGI
jgi:hypothetical protein